jgi:hypothetical protein
MADDFTDGMNPNFQIGDDPVAKVWRTSLQPTIGGDEAGCGIYLGIHGSHRDEIDAAWSMTKFWQIVQCSLSMFNCFTS